MPLRSNRTLPQTCATVIATVVATLFTANIALATDSPSTPITSASESSPTSTPAESKNQWDFLIGVPLWLPGFDGTIIVDGNEPSGGDGSSDIGETVNSHLNLAGALHFEAERNRFGLLADALYMDLRFNTESTGDDEASIRAFVGELGGFYTLVEPKQPAGWGMFRGDLLGGVRTSWLELGLDTADFTGTGDHTFYDPFVGGRIEVGLTDWLRYKLRGDVGGFGIGSDFSYQGLALFDWRANETIGVVFGYRIIGFDYEEGHGGGYKRFDLTEQGPLLGVAFSF